MHWFPYLGEHTGLFLPDVGEESQHGLHVHGALVLLALALALALTLTLAL